MPTLAQRCHPSISRSSALRRECRLRTFPHRLFIICFDGNGGVAERGADIPARARRASRSAAPSSSPRPIDDLGQLRERRAGMPVSFSSSTRAVTRTAARMAGQRFVNRPHRAVTSRQSRWTRACRNADEGALGRRGISARIAAFAAALVFLPRLLGASRHPLVPRPSVPAAPLPAAPRWRRPRLLGRRACSSRCAPVERRQPPDRRLAVTSSASGAVAPVRQARDRARAPAFLLFDRPHREVGAIGQRSTAAAAVSEALLAPPASSSGRRAARCPCNRLGTAWRAIDPRVRQSSIGRRPDGRSFARRRLGDVRQNLGIEIASRRRCCPPRRFPQAPRGDVHRQGLRVLLSNVLAGHEREDGRIPPDGRAPHLRAFVFARERGELFALVNRQSFDVREPHIGIGMFRDRERAKSI